MQLFNQTHLRVIFIKDFVVVIWLIPTAKGFWTKYNARRHNLTEILSIEAYTKDSYIATKKNGAKIKVSQDGYRKFRSERV